MWIYRPHQGSKRSLIVDWPEVEDDVVDAVTWYNDKRPGLT